MSGPVIAKIDAAPATFEGCAGGEPITEAAANAKPDKLRCFRCFPRRNREVAEEYGQREAS